MSKHTPGPWNVLTFSNHELQTDFAMVRIGDRVHMVGYSNDDWSNARLIAAAPDLLDALKKAIKKIEDCGHIEERGPDDALIAEMRAAIAKAEGLQHA